MLLLLEVLFYGFFIGLQLILLYILIDALKGNWDDWGDEE